MQADEMHELAWLTLIRTPGGAAMLRRALEQIPDISALVEASPATLRSLGFGEEAVLLWGGFPTAEAMRDREWLAQSCARLLPVSHPEYPAQLAALADAPLALFVLGDAALLQRTQLAVVGSRHPTAAGQRIAREITQALCTAGVVITSGMARGIDAAAHTTALDSTGATIAVLGTGLDQCYPASNRQLFDRIREHGALVSEFPPGTPARAQHFPRRNRIISGLALGVVVIEAAAQSGSLITARMAVEQGREVFAVPGSPLNPLAAGSLALIRSGAHLVRDAADILDEIGLSTEKNELLDQQVIPGHPPYVRAGGLDKEYEMLLDALGFEPASVDDLVVRTGLPAGSVASMLLILELDGRVEARPGALYNRVG